MTTQQEEQEALDAFRAMVAVHDLEPIRQCQLMDVGAVWVELSSAIVLKRWADTMHVVDATAGTYDDQDDYLRLNVRGRLEEIPVVVTLPVHWGMQPHMVTLIQMRISDRKPVALVRKLADAEARR